MRKGTKAERPDRKTDSVRNLRRVKEDTERDNRRIRDPRDKRRVVPSRPC
ncbi:MAG TPA: hypothetical protein VFS39_09735 [Nitrospira sp.]|nr:hypothetical protein [Nitrospira sp.]